MDNNAIAKVVIQYMAAWNEPEAATRKTLLEQCWGDNAVYVDPKVTLAGRVTRFSATSGRFRLGGPARGSNS